MRLWLAYALILAATIYVAWSMGGAPHPYTTQTQAWEGR